MARFLQGVSKETLLVVCVFVLLVSVASMIGGVVITLWTHDPWWLLVSLFGILLYGWVR